MNTLDDARRSSGIRQSYHRADKMKNEREMTIEFLQYLADWAKKESDSHREKLLGMIKDTNCMEYRRTLQLLIASRGLRLVAVKYAKEAFGVDLSENTMSTQPRGVTQLPDFQEPSWFIGMAANFSRVQALIDYQKHFARRAIVREQSYPEIPDK